MELKDTENRRAFFRLSYPISEQPKIEIEGNEMRVINISEEGVLAACEKIETELEQRIRARIFFPESGPTDVKGQIIRIDDGLVAVKMTEGIPMFQMIQEQQRLKQRYVAVV